MADSGGPEEGSGDDARFALLENYSLKTLKQARTHTHTHRVGISQEETALHMYACKLYIRLIINKSNRTVIFVLIKLFR